MSFLAINGREVESRELPDGTSRIFIDGRMCRSNLTFDQVLTYLGAIKRSPEPQFHEPDEKKYIPPIEREYFK